MVVLLAFIENFDFSVPVSLSFDKNILRLLIVRSSFRVKYKLFRV